MGNRTSYLQSNELELQFIELFIELLFDDVVLALRSKFVFFDFVVLLDFKFLFFSILITQ